MSHTHYITCRVVLVPGLCMHACKQLPCVCCRLSYVLSLRVREDACRYIDDGKMKTEYPIVIGGENFGCGSSREHAPVALGASGGTLTIAASLAGGLVFVRETQHTVA